MSFITFWEALNAHMAARGQDEVLLFDARCLWELFGQNTKAAAEHEIRLRLEANQQRR